jgi:fatty-acyl-CoA synthase
MPGLWTDPLSVGFLFSSAWVCSPRLDRSKATSEELQMKLHRLADKNGYTDECSDTWTLTDELWNLLESVSAPEAVFRFIDPVGEPEILSHVELVEQAARVTASLEEMGFKGGESVAIILPENDDFLRGFLGAVLGAMVPVPLFPPLGFGGLDAYVERNASILKASKARVLVTSKRLQNVMWSLISEVDTLEEILCIEDLADGDASKVSRPTVSPDDLCFLQYTSGSTAAPKGVMVSHRNLGANIYAIVHDGMQMDIGTEEGVSWLPMFHDMGLIGMTLAPLCIGLTMSYIPTLDFVMYPESWLQTISKYRAAATFAPNFAYALTTKKVPADIIEELDLSCLRVAGCGAEPIHPETMRAFNERFAPAGLRPQALVPAYGMAEATLAISFIGVEEPVKIDRVCPDAYEQEEYARLVEESTTDMSGRQAHEFVCCGRAIPRHTLKIVDEAGNILGDRQVGEIVFQGPSVVTGYYQEPEKTAEAFTDVGLRTGDLGYLVDGELYVTGRKKDLIIINGRNFDPQTIEWKVEEVPGVRKGNVAAFSIPSADSEELVVVAETKQGDFDRVEMAREIKKMVSSELFIKVSHVEIVGSATLPKTSSGKLQRSKARQQYLDGNIGRNVRAANRSVDVKSVGKHVTRSVVNRMRNFVKRRVGRLANTLRSLVLPR